MILPCWQDKKSKRNQVDETLEWDFLSFIRCTWEERNNAQKYVLETQHEQSNPSQGAKAVLRAGSIFEPEALQVT